MSVADIIKQAIFAQNNESRAAAEKLLYETLHNDPNSFLKQILEELLKETNEPGLRHASATIIKRAVLFKTNESCLWLNLNADTKKHIKTALLGNLITKDYSAMKGTADVISSIACIEIPRNEWNDLIPLLIQNVSHSNIEVKKAAIITLGFICDQLKTSNNSNSLDINSKELILKGILMGLNQTETNRDIIMASIKALHDSLNMMDILFEKKEIFNYFMKLILEKCVHSDIQIKIATLQCLIDFSKSNILKLPDIIETMLQILTNLILDKEVEVAIPAIELFNTIADEEKDNYTIKGIPNFQMTAKIAPALINLLLQNLTKGNKSEDDDDEAEGGLNIQHTSYRCLCSIVELLGDSCIEPIALFVSNLIASENLTHKKASLLAFSALMDGPSEEKIHALISSAFIPILELLFHKDFKVKKTSAFTICKIAEFHSISILKHSNFNDILPKLMEALNDNPAISKKICSTLGFISDSLKKLNGENIFVSHVENIINTLIKNSVREDLATKDLNLIESTFSAVMNIIHNLQNPVIIEKYLKLFVSEAKVSEALPPHKRENLMNGILSTIQACVLGLQGKIEEPLAQEIYHLVIQIFQNEKKVNSQGLHIISALAISISSNFKKFLPNFSPYLINALNNLNEPDILKAAIGNISDICRVCEHDFEGFLMQILPGLISSLNNHNFDKYIKLNIFSCIGDIALGCPKVLLPYFDSILSIYDSAFQAAIAMSNSNNAEALDYVEELKEKLIESFTCFIHSFAHESPHSEILMSHFFKLMEFIQHTCDSRVNPTIEYIRNCLNLIADIGKYYRNKVSGVVKINTTQNLLNILKKYTNDEENKFTINYVTQVIQAI